MNKPLITKQQRLALSETLARWLIEDRPHKPNWPSEMWQMFQTACLINGIAPHLHLKLQGVSWLEPENKMWLAEQYQLVSERINIMKGELKTILAQFERAQTPVIPLKGALLIPHYYPLTTVRPMADYDLLIKPDDAERAKTLLLQLGYQQQTVHWKHTEFVKPDNKIVIPNVSPDYPQNPRPIELHCHCRESFGGPTVDLTAIMWQNAQPGYIWDEPTLILNPGALWLHLLVHYTYHLWQGKGRLIHLLDLALLTPRVEEPVYWLNLVDGQAIYPALYLLRKYFPHILNEEILTGQGKRVSAKYVHWAHSRNLLNSSHLNPQPQGLYLSKAIAFADGRSKEIAQALRFSLLPHLSELALDHPKLAQSKAPWLAYFLLPFDWLKRLNGG